MYDGLEGVEHSEEVAVFRRERLKRGDEGELGGQLFRQVHPVGLLDLGSRPEAERHEAVVAVGQVLVLVVDQRHGRLQQIELGLCKQEMRLFFH